MRKLITTAALACASAAVLFAQTGTTGRGTAPAAPAAPKPAATTVQRSPVPAGNAKTSRAFLNQYCVGCHNTRSPQPSSNPVDLEKASLDDVLADADAWERA